MYPKDAIAASKDLVNFNKLINICRNKDPKELFTEVEFNVPLIDNFYEVPHDIPFPNMPAPGETVAIL